MPTKSIIARFVTSKDTYCLGEPIPVNFSIENTSSNDIHFIIGNLPQNDFLFSAKDEHGRSISAQKGRCAGDEWSPMIKLAPSCLYRRQLILNKYLLFKNVGTYTVKCEIHTPFMKVADGLQKSDGDEVNACQEITIRIEPFDLTSLRATATELVSLLTSPDTTTRHEAAEALSMFPQEVGSSYLSQALDSSDPVVRAHAVRGVAQYKGTDGVRFLKSAAVATDETTRMEILAGLRQVGNVDKSTSLEILGGFLKDKNARIRRTAIGVLANIEDTRRLQLLERMTEDPDSGVRVTAVRTLEILRKK